MATTASNSGVNSAPTLTAPVSVRHTEDAGRIGVNLLEGARDAEGNALSVTGLKLTGGSASGYSVKDGVLSLNTVQFNKLKAGESRTLTFTYLVSDGKLKTPQTLTLEIVGVNDAPVVKAALKASTTEDSAPLTVNLLSGATDVDGDALSVASFTQTAGPQAAFQIIDGQLVLDPTQFSSLKYGQSAVLTFTYMVSDGIAQVPQTVTVTVAGRNDAPVVEGAIVARTHEDAGTFTLNLLAGATDVDGDSLSVSGLKLVSGQSVKFTQKNGILSLDSNQFNALAVGQSQELLFTYLVSDGKGGTVAQNATVTVEGRNDAPVIKAALKASVTEDAAPLSVNLLSGASDVDGDTLSVSSLVQSGGPTASFSVTDGQLRLDPGQFNYLKSGQSAVLTFSYMVSDGIARVPQTVTVTVSGVNDGPVVKGAIVARTNEDAGTFTLNLLAGATDADGDSLSVSGLKLASGQSVKFTQSNGIISLDTNQFNALAVGQSQELVFTYLVSDGKGGTVAQKASVTVEGRNDSPVMAATVKMPTIAEDTISVGASVASLFQASFKDADKGGSFCGIAVHSLGADASQGSWQYSNDNGGNWINVPQPSGNWEPLIQAASLLRFVPAPNYFGTPPAMQVHGIDDSYTGSWVNSAGGASYTYIPPDNAGDAASSVLTSSIGITVTAVNDAPVVVDKTQPKLGYDATAEFTISTRNTYSQEHSKVIALKDGGFMVVWDTWDTSYPSAGQGTALVGQKFDAAGEKLGDEVLICTEFGYLELHSSLVQLSNGDIAVVWLSYATAYGRAGAVVGRLLDADGTPKGEEFVLNQASPRHSLYNTPDERSYEVFALDDGGFAVMWETSYDGYQAGVACRFFDADGMARGDQQVINATRVGDQLGVRGDALSDGGYVLTWHDASRSYIQCLDRTGARVGAEIQLPDRSARPDVVTLANGDFVAVWEQGGRVYTRHYSPTGEAIGSTDLLADKGGYSYATLLALPDGGYLITWMRSAEFAPSDYGILAQRFDANGNAIGPAVDIPQNLDGYQWNQDCTVLENGDVVFTWTPRRPTPHGIDSWPDIVGRILKMPPHFAEGGEAVRVFYDLGVSDVDSAVLKKATVTITNHSAGDVLSFTAQAGITGLFNSKTGVLTLSGSASAAAYEAVLESVRYNNASEAPSTDTRILSVVVSDGAAGSVAYEQSVIITAYNDAPVLTVSGIASGLKENIFGLTLAKVSVTDPEGDAFTLSIDDPRFEVVDGVLRLKAGVSLDYEAEPNGGSVTITATDSLGASSSTVVGYKVLNVNEPLKAVDDFVSLVEDQAVIIDILANDQHASTVRLPVITTASVNHGRVTINADGTLSYVPGANRDEPVVVSYTLAEDGKVSSAKVNISITAQADAPLLDFSGANGAIFSPFAFDISAALADIDNSEILSDVVIHGLPETVWLSAGRRNQDGDWAVPVANLEGLSAIATQEGSWSVTVTVSAREISNGDVRVVSVDGMLTAVKPPMVVSGRDNVGDVIFGGYLGDTLSGLGGQDFIYGGEGNDTLLGGNGDDHLFGGVGNDVIDGGAGNDTVTGGAGFDLITTGAGNDAVFLTQDAVNASTIDTGDGNDRIEMQAYAGHTIKTGAGIDVLSLQAGMVGAANIVTDFKAGAGGDQIDLYPLLKDGLVGWNWIGNPFGALGYLRFRQVGSDCVLELDRDGTAAANETFTPLLVLRNVSASKLTSANLVQAYDPFGASSGLVITGGDGNDERFGGSGNDYMSGGKGLDRLSGGDGFNVILGGADRDSLIGGAGFDLLDGGDGSDALFSSNGTNVIYGGAGDDSLYGGTGDDLLVGGAGRDNYHGGYGNDVFVVDDQGGDTIITSTGRDTIRLEGMTAFTEAVVVNDFAVGSGGDVIDFSQIMNMVLMGWDGQSNPFGSGFFRVIQSGADTLLQADMDGNGQALHWQTLVTMVGVTASALTEENFYLGYHPDGSGVYGVSLMGGGGNDTIWGSVGDDVLLGDSGADVLSGGAGGDSMIAGGGTDTLVGGTGNDTLSGGAGEDLYLFNRGDGADTIVNAAANLDNAADTLRFGAGIDGDDLWFARSGANLEVSVLGSVDKVVLAEWYSSTVGAKVQSLQLADGSTLDQSRVENLVSAMAAFNPPPATQTQLTTHQHQALDTVIAANWQHS